MLISFIIPRYISGPWIQPDILLVAVWLHLGGELIFLACFGNSLGINFKVVDVTFLIDVMDDYKESMEPADMLAYWQRYMCVSVTDSESSISSNLNCHRPFSS